jgi:hypothetical protein
MSYIFFRFIANNAPENKHAYRETNVWLAALKLTEQDLTSLISNVHFPSGLLQNFNNFCLDMSLSVVVKQVWKIREHIMTASHRRNEIELNEGRALMYQTDSAIRKWKIQSETQPEPNSPLLLSCYALFQSKESLYGAVWSRSNLVQCLASAEDAKGEPTHD